MSSKRVAVGALLLAGALASGCYSPAGFSGDGTLTEGGEGEAHRYVVESREGDFGSSGVSRWRFTSLPPGPFTVEFVGPCEPLKQLMADERRTVSLFFCEFNQAAANVAGGRMEAQDWALTARGDECVLTPQRWRPALPQADAGETFDLVVEVKGAPIAGGVKVVPRLTWKRAGR